MAKRQSRGRKTPGEAEAIFATYPPLVLERGHGTVLRLTVYSYQSPKITGGSGDANWVQVLAQIETKRLVWPKTAAALLADEVELIHLWFEALSRGEPPGPPHWFLEPQLAFSLVEAAGEECIQVAFGLELYPVPSSVRRPGGDSP